MTYCASRHCGKVAFEVEGEIVRCVEGIDLVSIPVTHFDARSK